MRETTHNLGTAPDRLRLAVGGVRMFLLLLV